ncbi:MAG: tetratricopeptide repeat protein, partial [Methyloligellaceae bacterium]
MAARKIAGAASELTTRVEQPAQIDPHGVLVLYRSGKVREAGKRARKLMRKHPDALILYDIRTAALVSEGKLAEAAACCRRALKINPHHLDAHSNLGAILRKLGKIEEAALSYCKALAIDPGRAETLNNLGNVLSELGRFDEAAASYARAVRATPSSLETLSRFAATLQRVSNVDAAADFKDLIVLCFEHSSIASTSVRPISHRLLKSDLQEFIAADTLTSSDLADLNPSTDGLLAAHLNRSLIADTDLELFLCRVRSAFLELRSQCDLAPLADGTALPLLRSLAYQGFLNEYLWHVTDEEDSCIDALEAEIAGVVQSGGAPEEIDLYLLAAYRPLYEIECIRCWALRHCGDVSAELNRFLRDVILDLDRERDIGRQIGRLTSIEDDVSTTVRAQYEENPYPRWNSLSVGEPRPYTEQILWFIAPHRPALEQTSPAPDVLVAGCGTGRHPITTALGYLHSNVLAVDLSRTSLAFAQRKAK